MSKLLDDIMQRAEELSSEELREISDFCNCLASGENNCKRCGSEEVTVYDNKIKTINGIKLEKWIECHKCGSILQEE